MSVRKGFIVSILAVIFASFNSHQVNAQYDEDSRPYPELSAGLKAVMGYFEFGKNYYQSTGDNALGFQPTVRYDLPVKLFTIKDRPAYITFNFATGILYVVNNETSVNGFDPVSGQPNSFIKHKSPVFVPIYVGLYNPGAFGLGLEAFYAKGFNGGCERRRGILLTDFSQQLHDDFSTYLIEDVKLSKNAHSKNIMVLNQIVKYAVKKKLLAATVLVDVEFNTRREETDSIYLK